MSILKEEIAAYEAQQHDLEARHRGRWVLFHGSTRVGIYDTFEEVSTDALRKYGRGPYLIREIGVAPAPLPAIFRYAGSA